MTDIPEERDSISNLSAEEREAIENKILKEQAEICDRERGEVDDEDAAGNPLQKVTKEDIAFIISTICKEAKYDEPSVKQLFYGMATAFTKLGLGHKVNSRDSGAGKSYLTNKVADYYPDTHVLILGGASNKAFQHMEGDIVVKDEETGKMVLVQPIIDEKEEELDNLDPNKGEDFKKIKKIQKEIKELKKYSKKRINLDDTIIVIQDTPQEGLLASLMSLISQDGEKDQEYIFVDKTNSGKMQGTSNIIHGMPVIFYTRTLDDTKNTRAEEVFRRFINVTPNTTKNKIQEANRITFKRYGLLPERYDETIVSREDKVRAKQLVARIVENLKLHTKYLEPKKSGIDIPFEGMLGHSMPSDNVFQMTVSDRTARYLAIITKVNMYARPRFVHRITGAFYPIANFEDLKEAFAMMEMGGSSVRPYLVVMYNEVIFPLYSLISEPCADKDETGNVLARERYKGLRVQEIIEGVKQILGFNISAKDMYSKYLTPMGELGLINWARSVLKGNEKIYFPSDPDAERVFSMFPDNNDLRLLVTDALVYPTKEVIEQSYGITSKLSWEQAGKKNIFETYQLLDPDGQEITIQQLVERYLNNPELCFKPGWPQMKRYDTSEDKTELESEEVKRSEFMTCHDCGEVIPLFYVKIHQCEKKVYKNRNQTYATQVLINHLQYSK